MSKEQQHLRWSELRGKASTWVSRIQEGVRDSIHFLQSIRPFRDKLHSEIVMLMPDLDTIARETGERFDQTRDWHDHLIRMSIEACRSASKRGIQGGWAFLLSDRDSDPKSINNPRIRIFPDRERIGGLVVPNQNLAGTGLKFVGREETGKPFVHLAIAYCRDGGVPSGIDIDALARGVQKNNPLVLLVDPGSRKVRVICFGALNNRLMIEEPYSEVMTIFPLA